MPPHVSMLSVSRFALESYTKIRDAIALLPRNIIRDGTIKGLPRFGSDGVTIL